MLHRVGFKLGEKDVKTVVLFKKYATLYEKLTQNYYYFDVNYFRLLLDVFQLK